MSELRKYTRRANTAVSAIQLTLDLECFTYRKWGGVQTAHTGDWLIKRGDDVYTVEQSSFAKSYKPLDNGRYIKTQPVWARQANEDGAIKTKEGATHYKAGDMIVFNDEEESDGYAMSLAKFESLYEPA